VTQPRPKRYVSGGIFGKYAFDVAAGGFSDFLFISRVDQKL
jgi:hypothetical protein